MTPSPLVVTNLVKSYRRVQALRGVSLQVEPGEVLGLVGPNGAGKSTLVRIVCGLARPSEGQARVCGESAGSRAARALTGYLPERYAAPSWMRAEAVLAYHQGLARSPGGAAERAELLERLGIADAATATVAELSKGMQQRLGIAQSLLGSPALVVLDEPAAGLDPDGRALVRELLAHLRARGAGVLLNSHHLGDVERSCDRALILRAGEVVAETGAGTARAVVVVRTARGRREFPDVSPAEVPDLVARLVGEGERVYDVGVEAADLEQAYRSAVRGGEPEEPT